MQDAEPQRIMTLFQIAGVLLSLAVSTAAPAGAEGSGPASTMTVVPGARYKGGWFKRLLLGGHWRDAWITRDLARASSPATGSAMRFLAPLGRALPARLCAVMLLKALTTGRPSTLDTQPDSVVPRSIASMHPSRRYG